MLTFKPEYLPLKPGDIILDLGCGEGRHVCALLDLNIELNVIGLDLDSGDLQFTNSKLQTWYQNKVSKVHLIQATGFKLPFSDNCIDHIICSEVLEHIHDYPSVIAEIKRITKDKGHLCISVPRAWPEKICWYLSKEYHQVKGGHVQIFNSRKLKNEITDAGFKSYKTHWAHALHSPYWWLKCLFWKQKKENFLLRAYHQFLVWDLMEKPKLTYYLEACLNPFLGKSVVLYFRKQ